MSNQDVQPVKVDLKTLTKQVEEGMKKDELAAFYNLPIAQVTKLLKSAKLKIRKFHKPKFILTTEEEETQEVDAQEDVQQEDVSVEKEEVVSDSWES